jgi:hypothetical protein
MQSDGAPARRRRTGHADFERLHRRDLEVLGWVCEQYVARLDQVEVLLAEGPRACAQMVGRLCEVGFARTQSYLVGEAEWLLPTQRGLRVCGLVCRPRIPAVGRLAHIAAINDVRLHIERRAPRVLWVSERQLLMEHPKTVHVPDGVAVFEERRVAIEVELTLKRPFRVRAILADLEGRYDGVLYYCARATHPQLSGLVQSGAFPALGVRELPGPEVSVGVGSRGSVDGGAHGPADGGAPDRALGRRGGEQ